MIIDFDALIARLGCRPDAVRRLVHAFVQQLLRDIAALRDAAHRGDASDLARISHGLAGAAASVSSEPIRSLAARIEAVARGGTTEGTGPLLAELGARAAELDDELPELERALAGTRSP